MRMTKAKKQLAVYAWMGLYGTLRAAKVNRIEAGEKSVVYYEGLNVGNKVGVVNLIVVCKLSVMDGVVYGDDDDHQRGKSWDLFLESVKLIEIV